MISSLNLGRNGEEMSVEKYVMDMCCIRSDDDNLVDTHLVHDSANKLQDQLKPITKSNSPKKKRKLLSSESISSEAMESSLPMELDSTIEIGSSSSRISYLELIDGDGWNGWHCEGRYLHSLFALLMWDVIFADVGNVFLSRYQDAPLDFRHHSFLRSRYGFFWN